MKNFNALDQLLTEDQWLWEATAASEEAKKYKLKHVGGGAWANEHGIIVAKTNRATKQLEWMYGSPEDSANLTSVPAGALSSKAVTADPDAPQGATVSKEDASKALNKISNYFTQVLELPDNIDYNVAIVKSILAGEAVINVEGLSPEVEQNVRDALDEFVLNSKNKLANQIRAYYQAQNIDVKDAEEVPGPESKKAPFTPKKVGGTGEYDFVGAMGALGLDPNENPDAFDKLIMLAGQAKNQNKLNYIGAKLIKAGLIDKQQWKAFRKYHRNAFGVLPAGKNGDEESPVDAPSEPPQDEPVEDPYEPQAPALSHPAYKGVADFLNAAGSEMPVHAATPEQMDAISAGIEKLYLANNTEELKQAIALVPFVNMSDEAKILAYMQDTFPKSFAKDVPVEEPPLPPEEDPIDEPTQEEPPTQSIEQHPDYDTVSFWMDKAGAFNLLQSLSYGDIKGLYTDISAATQATTYGERFDAIMRLVDNGLLPYGNAVDLQDAIEAAYGNKSGDVQAAQIGQDTDDIEDTHPVWGIPSNMTQVVDQAISVLGPWAESDVAFLPKLEKQALANAILNAYEAGSASEVDNQFDMVDSKVALAGYQLKDIADKVKAMIYGGTPPEAPAPEVEPTVEPTEPEEPTSQFTPEEQEFVQTFNDLPDDVRFAAAKFVTDAMKSGIFKEPSKDIDFPMMLSTVGTILNGGTGDAFESMQSLYNAKLVNPIYSPAMLMTKLLDAQKALGITAPTPEQVPQAVEPEPEAAASVEIPDEVKAYTPMATAAKAANTIMNKEFTENDPTKALSWVMKKFNDPKTTGPHWKDMAIALVKNHGLPLSAVPAQLLPDSLKSVKAAAPAIAPQTPQAVEPEPAAQAVEPEPQAPQTDVNTPDAALSYASGYLSNFGINVAGLDGEKKVAVVDAVQNAFKSDTDFGVMYAMSQLKKAGFLKPEEVDGLGMEILDKLESEGKISDDPEAFKKFLSPSHFTDQFFAQNPAFAATLSDEQKQHINNVVQQGLDLKDDPGAIKGSTVYPMTGYQKSKQLYKAELVDKVPGFSEDIFQKFRSGAMQYHDELKNLAKFSDDKKAAAKQAKEEAIQLQKAMAALGSGDTAQAIGAIVDVVGISDPQQKQKVMVTVAQALQQPTSQLMLDKLNTLTGANAYGGGGLGSSAGMNASAYKTLRSLVAATFFDQKNPNNTVYVEPPVTEPAEKRAQNVFDKWTQTYGVTLGHFPKQTGYYNTTGGERDAIKNAVIQALNEPDQKKVNNILNSLFVTATSMTDKQINQLRQLVHSERKSPASLDPTYKPLTPSKYTASAASTSTGSSKIPAKDISSDPEYLKKSKYYKLPETNKQAIHDTLFDVLGSASISSWNKDGWVNKTESKLQQLGLDSATARKVALWAVRENSLNNPLSAKAKSITAANTSTSSTGSKSLPAQGDEVAAKQFVANLTSQQDSYELASVEYVKGEQVRVTPSLQWTGTKNTNTNDYSSDLSAQTAWRKTNRTPEDINKFNTGMSSWLGGGQWNKPAEQRKALNEIMTRMVEGPPPQYMQVKTHVERGMSVSPDDFKDYIKAFKVGEPVYIGPSGFSANSGTANSFGADPSSQNAEYVKVLLRVKPDKSGKIRGVRLDPFGSEQECVVGTSRQTRCTNVIKHVTPDYYGKMMVAYEIELEYDETIEENKILGESVGFNMSYWKGLSKETVKAMIKYNNSSVHTEWDQ